MAAVSDEELMKAHQQLKELKDLINWSRTEMVRVETELDAHITETKKQILKLKTMAFTKQREFDELKQKYNLCFLD